MMYPGNRNYRRMAGRMGMDMKEIPEVTEVVIRTADRELVITKPVVNEVESKENTTFVVVADGYEEREVEKPQFSEDDVDIVCLKTGVDRDRAVAALTECEGEVATAIVRLASG
ncbi:MAG: transcription factor [Thaumarchaeota archaeon]|nr:transcription factor [Nitrososphaerota archaeon]